MKSFYVLSLSLTAWLALAACSSGGRTRIQGTQCTENYSPIDMAAKPEQKLWEKGQNESAIPAGNYLVQRADLVYVANGNDPLIIHVQDTKVPGGAFKPSVACVRNAAAMGTNPDLSVASNYASKILARASAAAEVEVKELGFATKDGRLTAESKALEKTDSLEKAYAPKADEFFMLKTNDVEFEVRSKFSDNQGSYTVSVKFQRIDPLILERRKPETR